MLVQFEAHSLNFRLKQQTAMPYYFFGHHNTSNAETRKYGINLARKKGSFLLCAMCIVAFYSHLYLTTLLEFFQICGDLQCFCNKETVQVWELICFPDDFRTINFRVSISKYRRWREWGWEVHRSWSVNNLFAAIFGMKKAKYLGKS